MHTKGTWKVIGDLRENAEFDIYTEDNRQCIAVTTPILDYDNKKPYPVNRPECKSNANLIAASPELYEALKAFVSDAYIGCYCASLKDLKIKCNICIAMAAIAKAEGKG
jgi:hypothetical protein